MKLKSLSKKFLKLEFRKNVAVNYIVRCMEVGDEEEYQILERPFEDIKITSETIPLEIRENVNTILEKCINGHQNEDMDEKLIMLELIVVLNLLKPYITWPELYESNFGAWECLILEDYKSLKELG